MDANRSVRIHRTLRDGRETDEIVPEYVARIIVESIFATEPETARAMIHELPRIEVDPKKPYPRKATKPDYSIAIGMAGFSEPRLVA